MDTLEIILDQRNELRERCDKLVAACSLALGAYDAAHADGKSAWGGADVDFMRHAVESAKKPMRTSYYQVTPRRSCYDRDHLGQVIHDMQETYRAGPNRRLWEECSEIERERFRCEADAVIAHFRDST